MSLNVSFDENIFITILYRLKEYDGRTFQNDSFVDAYNEVITRLTQSPSLPSADLRDRTFLEEINYILKITWVDMQPPGSSNGSEVRVLNHCYL